MKEVVTKCKKGIKNIKQKNRAQIKLGFRDTSTESSNFCQHLFIYFEERRKEDREAAVRR